MKNEGTVDRVIRTVIGLVLISLVFVGPQTAWGWVGLVPLVTGIVGFCPLYKVLGLNTCPIKK
jgi:fatty acid desaturase